MKTVSLELAKQLKEAGYPQESTFYFCEDMGERTYSKDCKPYEKRNCGEHPATPTADEILDQLPHRISPPKTGTHDRDNFLHDLKVSKIYNPKAYTIDYVHTFHDIEHPDSFGNTFAKHGIKEKTLADVAARMWLYLKENDLLDR